MFLSMTGASRLTPRKSRAAAVTTIAASAFRRRDMSPTIARAEVVQKWMKFFTGWKDVDHFLLPDARPQSENTCCMRRKIGYGSC